MVLRACRGLVLGWGMASAAWVPGSATPVAALDFQVVGAQMWSVEETQPLLPSCRTLRGTDCCSMDISTALAIRTQGQRGFPFLLSRKSWMTVQTEQGMPTGGNLPSSTGGGPADAADEASGDSVPKEEGL